MEPGTWSSSPGRAIAARTNSFPFAVFARPGFFCRRSRVTGGVSRAGVVSVRVSVGLSVASGSGGLSVIQVRAGGAGSSPATAAGVAGGHARLSTPMVVVPAKAGPTTTSADCLEKAVRRIALTDGPRVWAPAFAGATRLESARRQDHDDLAAFETRVLLDLGKLGDVALDLVEKLGADFLMRHFAAAIAQGDLDLVAFLENRCIARIFTS